MNTRRFMYLRSIIVLLLALVFARPVSAHGDDPRIEISAERLNPGSVLDVRGVDFEFEEEVVLVLAGPQVEVPLGTVIADTEGIFLLTITLPTELVEGAYVIRGTTDDHVVDSFTLTIWGTAALGGGEEGPREEQDGLLAPMPTFAPSGSIAVPEVASPVESTPPETSSMPLLWIAAGIGIILLLGLIIKVKK